jgi:hypothetical protein
MQINFRLSAKDDNTLELLTSYPNLTYKCIVTNHDTDEVLYSELNGGITWNNEETIVASFGVVDNPSGLNKIDVYFQYQNNHGDRFITISSRNPYTLTATLDIPYRFEINWELGDGGVYHDNNLNLNAYGEAEIIQELGTFSIDQNTITHDLSLLRSLIQKYQLIIGDYKVNTNIGFLLKTADGGRTIETIENDIPKYLYGSQDVTALYQDCLDLQTLLTSKGTLTSLSDLEKNILIAATKTLDGITLLRSLFPK